MITAQLYEVSAHNPALLGATSAILATVALLACSDSRPPRQSR